MRMLALLLLLTSCKSSFSEEKVASLTTQLQTDATLARNETRTVTQGPETDLSLTFAGPAADPAQNADPGSISPTAVQKSPILRPPIVLTGKPSDLAAILDALPHGPLIGATLAQKGPTTDASALQVNRATETKAAAKSDSTDDLKKARAPAGLFGGLLSMWPWLLAAGIAAALYFRKDLVLGFLKTLAGRFIP